MAGLSLVALLLFSPPLAAQLPRNAGPRPGLPIIPPAAAPAQAPAAAPPTAAGPQTATGTRHGRPIAAMHRAPYRASWHREGWRQQARYRRGWHRYRRHHVGWGGRSNRVAEQLNAEELNRVSAPPAPASPTR